jgi:hypothetical protein
MIEAARAFRFAGADLRAGDHVVGLAGEQPSARQFSALLRTGKIIIRDVEGELPKAAETRSEQVSRRARKKVSA